MRIKTIVFLLQSPLTKRDHERFGIEILKSRGFNVIVIDATEVFTKDFSKKLIPGELEDYDNLCIVKTKKEFIAQLKKLVPEETIIIDEINGRPDSAFVYKIFRSFGLVYAAWYSNAIPVATKTASRIFKKRNIGKYLNFLNNKYISWLRKRYPPKYVFVGGKASFDKNPFKNSNAVWAHTSDYDKYLKYKSEEQSQNGDEYIVYLDEDFPNHPDFEILGIEKPVKNPGEFYKEMDEIFKIFESKTGLPVIIAAHPRSDYEGKDFFSRRKVFKHKTIELVSNAKYVLAHCSTSVNYAVLFRKPLFFLLPKILKNSYYEDQIKSFAGHFNKKPYESDSVNMNDILTDSKVDEELYRKYKENYIKTDSSPDKMFWDIIADALIKSKEN